MSGRGNERREKVEEKMSGRGNVSDPTAPLQVAYNSVKRTFLVASTRRL